MKTNDFSDERDDIMKNSYQWDVKSFVDESALSVLIDSVQREGWEVFYIDLKESKVVIRKPLKVRLDD